MSYSLRRFNKSGPWLLLGIVGLIALTVIIVFWQGVKAGSVNTDPHYSTYAGLADAAWRRDDGTGNVLVTATLYSPAVIHALDAVTATTDTQAQLQRALKGLPTNAVAVLLSVDSVQGAIPDKSLTDSLHLSAQGLTFTSADWQPIILASNVANTNIDVSEQNGLAVFTTNQPIQWGTVKDLSLTMVNIGGQAVRKFVWSDPALLSAIR